MKNRNKIKTAPCTYS